MAIIIMERGGPNMRLAVCGFSGTAKVSHTLFKKNLSLSLPPASLPLPLFLSLFHTNTRTFAKRDLDKLTPLVPCKELDYRAKLNK